MAPQKHFLAAEKHNLVASLQFVHGVLRALDKSHHFHNAVPLVYSALFPTVFDGRSEQEPVATATMRQYAPLASLRPFSTAW